MSKAHEEKDLPPPYTPTPTHNYSPPDYDSTNQLPPPSHTRFQQPQTPQQPMPYSRENDASSSSSSRGSTVGQMGQAALGVVGSIINSRLEHRQRKLEKRQARCERRNLRKGKSRDTSYTGCGSQHHAQEQSNHWQNGCSRSMSQNRNMEGGAGRVTWFNDEKVKDENECRWRNNAQSRNMENHDDDSSSDSDSTENSRNTAEQLDIKRKNTSFEFNEDWFGKECSISTSNGSMVIRGTLEAKKSISLKVSNGAMTVEGDLVSGSTISVEGSNGPFLPRGQIILSKNISIKTSNAPLQFDTMIQGEYVKLKTSNAPIILTNMIVNSELNVKTSCAPIELHIDDLGPKAVVNIETTTAPVKIFMPRSFAGEFSIKTSLASTEVVSKSEGTDVTITKDEGTCTKGVCTKYGQKGNASVTIKTTLAHAILYL